MKAIALALMLVSGIATAQVAAPASSASAPRWLGKQKARPMVVVPKIPKCSDLTADATHRERLRCIKTK